MSGFEIDGKTYPALWAGTGAGADLVFVYVHEQGDAIALMSKDYLADIAHDMANDDREDPGYSALYVLLPGHAQLIQCVLTVQTDHEDNAHMVITSAEGYAVLYKEKL